jgi:hypothetical protein
MTTNNPASLLILIMAIGAAKTAVAADSDGAAGGGATPKIERLALFKNGLGFATATATLPASRSVRIGQLPVPSFGTFWVGYPEGVAVRSLTTSMETVDEPVLVAGMDQLLRLNPGRKVTIHMLGGAGAEASIRINRAMNVQAEQAEVEVERKRNAASFYGYGYDLVKLTGELKLRNRLDKSIHVEIIKELSGEVLEKPDATKDVQTSKGLKQVNPKHILTYTLELAAGTERKINYSYQLFIRP